MTEVIQYVLRDGNGEFHQSGWRPWITTNLVWAWLTAAMLNDRLPYDRQYVVEMMNEVKAKQIYQDSFKPEHQLPPYVSQWGDGADERTGDCGPACVAMLVHGYTASRPTVDQVAAKCGQPSSGEGSKYTGHQQLINGAKEYGIILQTRSPYTERHNLPRLSMDLIKEQVDDGLYPICLIHYGILRDLTNAHDDYVHNQDQAFARGHWVVALKYNSRDIYIHDPDFWGGRAGDGDTRAIPIVSFETALKTRIVGSTTVGEQGLIVASYPLG